MFSGLFGFSYNFMIRNDPLKMIFVLVSFCRLESPLLIKTKAMWRLKIIVDLTLEFIPY